MGFLDRIRGGLTGGPAKAEVHIGDPRFDGWEVVAEYSELETARAFRDSLQEAGIPSELTADWELDRFGRGDIYLQVPPGHWSDAEEHLSNMD